jgi:hypothetical protein
LIVPYSGGENDLLDAGERAMLAYQRGDLR